MRVRTGGAGRGAGRAAREREALEGVMRAVAPLRAVCRVFGMAPCSWDDPAVPCSRAAIWYSCAVALLFLVDWAALFTSKIVFLKTVRAFTFIDVAEMTSMTTAGLMTLTRDLRSRGNTARALSKLATVDAALAGHFKADFGAENRHCFVLVRNLLTSSVLMTILDAIAWGTATGPGYYFFSNFQFYPLFFLYQMSELQFLVFVKMLAARFRRFNELLKTPEVAVEELLRLRVLHDRLCDCAVLLNDLFSFYMLISVITGFSNLMGILATIPKIINEPPVESQAIKRIVLMIALCIVAFHRFLTLALNVNAANDVATEAALCPVLAHKLLLLVSVESEAEAMANAPKIPFVNSTWNKGKDASGSLVGAATIGALRATELVDSLGVLGDEGGLLRKLPGSAQWAAPQTAREGCEVARAARGEAGREGRGAEHIAHLEALVRASRLRLVRFSAAGFFAVDRPLLGAIVGSLATYLLVTAQFDYM